MRLLLLVLLLPAMCLAGQNDYQCQVRQVNKLGDDGKLVVRPEWMGVGEKFAVDRDSGAVVGGPFATYDLDKRVLDRGDKEYSFKLLTLTGKRNIGHANAEYLAINEFQTGRSKAFVGISSTFSLIISGTCE